MYEPNDVVPPDVPLEFDVPLLPPAPIVQSIFWPGVTENSP
jgi:hypothetical protein